ncbi:helix-turn-helix transcriptional regulator [Mucilaginibacter sp. CAU 1740]|uniref:helix-turn-helix domain-containing protein n=1 Tax=Mucilaginibacter sp. CAU 1740 TaxID=3140365 RepID=UPI00325A8963
MSEVGNNIKMLRQQKGWNQKHISELLNMSTPAFSKIETGVTDVNLSRLEQIASVFDLSVIELLTLHEPDRHEATDKLANIREMLSNREGQLFQLQKKIIELYEELHIQNSKPRLQHDAL